MRFFLKICRYIFNFIKTKCLIKFKMTSFSFIDCKFNWKMKSTIWGLLTKNIFTYLKDYYQLNISLKLLIYGIYRYNFINYLTYVGKLCKITYHLFVYYINVLVTIIIHMPIIFYINEVSDVAQLIITTLTPSDI